ncbi:MAG TPA: hypothetical protein VL200_11510 [Lacunisphaera sp.]|nr:hypothetical protein [Lacunisphaera sp.]
MPDPIPTPLQQTVRWLADHARFPASRLPEKAELLLLVAAAAADEELAAKQAAHPRIPLNPNFSAQIRNYTAQRRRAHLRSDNSAKT